ncbi:RHS repeat-associated core domain-containing protein [Nocardiopsis nanhaiensis]
MATTAATTLTLGLLTAPPAWADDDPHSPADRTVPVPETWEPGEAKTEPVGDDPPQEPWEPVAGEDSEGDEGERSPGWTCSSNEENLGIADWYPMQRHQISDRLDVDINLESGNAVIRHRDLTVGGTGLDLGLNSVYNSRDLNIKWKQSLGRDIGLMFESDRVAFHGPTGSCDEFMENEDGGYDAPAGLNATLTELDNGHWALTYTRGEFEDQVWHFDANGWAVLQADRNGNSNHLRYSSSGDLAAITDTQGRVTELGWDDQGRPTEVTDPTGEEAVAFDYPQDHDRHPTTLTDRAGNDIGFAYDDGYLTEITDPEGGTWELSYDPEGRVTSFTEPYGDGGSTHSFDHGDGHTTVTDPDGGESTFEFDDQGRQIEATDQVGNTRSQTWTANSDVATTTDALEASVSYDYDDANNLIGTELPTGAETSVGYGDAANPAKPTDVTTPDGAEMSLSYDDAGNLSRAYSEDEDITIAEVNYNHDGTVSSQDDGNGNRTTFSYDDVGNLTAMAEPGPVGEVSFGYDTLSRVTSVTDGNGRQLDYDYDRLDRVVAISHDGDVLESFEYDANGRQLATHTDQATTEFSFNARGDVTESVRTDSAGEETTSYGYDVVGNLTEFTEHGRTTTYAYDAAFRLTELVDDTGAETTFDSNANNQRTSIAHPDGAQEDRSYDDSGRLTSITTTGAEGQELVEASYTWDTADGDDSDQLQSRTINGESEDFSYDGLQRLTSNGEVDYTYDDAGNLLEAGEEEFEYNDADQPTTARGDDVSNDEAGNMVGRGEYVYEYSVTNQNTRTDDSDGSLATSLSYDTTDQTQLRGVTDVHEDERIERQLSNTALGVTGIASDGERTSYVRDPEGELISMVSAGGDERYHYTTDHQNTVLAVTAEDSEAEEPDAVYEYTPYGKQTSETLEDTRAGELNPFGYTGAYQFQDGTVHLSHRFYDTFTLGFTQPDPSRQELNNHTYAMCDPINNTDPTGLNTLPSWQCARSAGYFIAGFASVTISFTSMLFTAGAATPAAMWSLGLGVVGIAGGIEGMATSC